jgi:hypothetical protein
VASSFEHGNEFTSSINIWEFLERLSNCGFSTSTQFYEVSYIV